MLSTITFIGIILCILYSFGLFLVIPIILIVWVILRVKNK